MHSTCTEHAQNMHTTCTAVCCTCVADRQTITRLILLRMQNAVDKTCTTHFSFSTTFFRKSFRLWDNVGNMVGPDRTLMTWMANALLMLQN